MSQKKEQKRFADFFASERTRLVAYVERRVGAMAECDAEDFVQEIALTLFSRADLAAPIENLAAYVYRALRNKIVDYFKSRKRTQSLDAGNESGDSLIALLADTRYDTAGSFERKAFQAALIAAMERLSEEERALIIATEFDGVSFREFAQRDTVPLGTLLSRKARALKKVRVMLEHLGMSV